MRNHTTKDILAILRRPLVERPVEGKTYSLYGESTTTDDYFHRIEILADLCFRRCPDPAILMKVVQQAGRQRRRLRRYANDERGDALVNFVLRSSRGSLAVYTKAVHNHLRTLPLTARLDRTLSTTEEQYHLSMLEIELANRIFGGDFRKSRTKLAFLPHCLRDWSRDCRAAEDGYDYVCRGCSKGCWVNGVSKLLRLHDVTPYIWMSADLSRLFRKLRREESDLGVVGIACVPELVRGMRLCMRYQIPVVGVPLNANRCARWMGNFCDNSVNLQSLAGLLRTVSAQG